MTSTFRDSCHAITTIANACQVCVLSGVTAPSIRAVRQAIQLLPAALPTSHFLIARSVLTATFARLVMLVPAGIPLGQERAAIARLACATDGHTLEGAMLGLCVMTSPTGSGVLSPEMQSRADARVQKALVFIQQHYATPSGCLMSRRMSDCPSTISTTFS
jgi:hypothetical protein